MNRTIRTLIALSAAALAVAGCGNREEIVHHAETEGVYVDVGALDYQVQISRELNPAIVPDSAYLSGLPEFVGSPDDDETWFGVFMRVQNETDEPAEMAEPGDFEIVDTVGKTYHPVDLEEEANPHAYAGGTLAPGEVAPSADAVAGDSPTQGRLLLYKITYQSLQNRPLILKITGPDGEEAEIDLDI